MDNGLPQDKPVTLKDIEQINKLKHHKNMQNKMHRIDDSYQIPGEKQMSTADKPTSKFMDAMQQVLANEAEIMEKKKMTQGDIAALAGDPKKIDADDFAALRAKKHLKKEETTEPRPGTLAKIIATPGHPLRSSARKELKDREKEAAEMKKEEVESLDEISQKTATSAYADATTGSFYHPKAGAILDKIKKKFGDKAADNAETHSHVNNYGRRNTSQKDDLLTNFASRTKTGPVNTSGVIYKGTQKANANRIKSRLGSHTKPNLPEEVEMNEAATVLLRKGGATKRMRYNPASIERLKREGWVVASEAFVDKVRTMFDIAEDISFEDALSLVEAVAIFKEEEAAQAPGGLPKPRGRGRPRNPPDPDAAPKRIWTPGSRGRKPNNWQELSKVTTSSSKTAAMASPEPKAADDATDTGHILDHLRKAISTNGTNSFRQKNGSMAKVSQSAAIALLTHHDKLPKASDRFAMQQHLAKSPEHLQNAIKNVNAGKPYNAGYEKAKPKAISLAPGGNPDWYKKK